MVQGAQALTCGRALRCRGRRGTQDALGDVPPPAGPEVQATVGPFSSSATSTSSGLGALWPPLGVLVLGVS